MFSSFSLPFGLGFGRKTTAIDLQPVKEHNVETNRDKRARTLKHLIKANHVNHSIIWNNLRFHNHTPHALGTAYIFGADPDQLTHVYEEETKNIEPWEESPGEISKDDWRDFLGKRNYQRAYVDFFEDQLVEFGYDWKKLVEHYLYEGKEPLINSLVSGLGHPLIHLGYAYELSSQEVAIESLALGTCFYSDLHKYIDDPSYTKPGSYKTSSIAEILQKVAQDERFDGLFDHQGADNIELALKEREDVILDHWNAWDVPSDPKAHFADSQFGAVAVVVGTPEATTRSSSKKDKKKKYDFFLLHGLTTSHACRILLPLIPAKYQVSLVRQWFLFVLLAYIAQDRPKIDISIIEDYPLDGRDWWYVDHMALTSDHRADAHYIKGLRAMKVAAETWGDEKQFYLKAAVKMASEFNGWGGFGELTQGYQPYY